MHDPLRVRVGGPLAPYTAGYAAELARVGYTASGATLQLRLVANVSAWLDAEGLEAGALSAAQVDRFLVARRAAGRTRYASIRAIRPLLEYLRGLGVVPVAPEPVSDTPIDRLLARYRRYLVVERSLAPTTASGYLAAIRPFLASRVTPNGLALEALTVADVTSFVVTHCPSQPRGSAKLTVTALRSLLRFLHLEGIVAHPLAASVPRIAAWRLAPLPRGLTRAEVERLLAACDRSRATGCRDFAVLTLLRPARAAGGQGGGAHARCHRLAGGRAHRHRQGRPSRATAAPGRRRRGDRGVPPPGSSRECHRARGVHPGQGTHRALSSNGVSRIVADAALRAGLGLVHAHRLRHTAATEMFRAGGSLAEIGQVLRHRRTQTTAIYANVYEPALRALARPWPGGVA